MKNPSSARRKKRYLVFRIHSEGSVDFHSMRNAVWNSLLNWIGESGTGKANITVYRNLYKPSKGTGFIQCSPKHIDDLKVSLSLIHQIGDQRVAFQTLRVAGTIKSGKSFLSSTGKR